MSISKFYYSFTNIRNSTESGKEALIDIAAFDISKASFELTKNIKASGGYMGKSWKAYKAASDTLDSICTVVPSSGVRTHFDFSKDSKERNKNNFDTLLKNIQGSSKDYVFNNFVVALSKVSNLASIGGAVPSEIVTMLNTTASISNERVVSKLEDKGTYLLCREAFPGESSLIPPGTRFRKVTSIGINGSNAVATDSKGVQTSCQVSIDDQASSVELAPTYGEIKEGSILITIGFMPVLASLSTQYDISFSSSATTYTKDLGSVGKLDSDTVLFGGQTIKAGDFYDELGGRPYNDGIGGRNSGNSELKRDAFTLDFFDPITKRTVPIASNWNAVGGSTDIFGVQLGIYPDSLQVSSSKVISRQMTFTRWVEEHWGDDLDSLSFSGSSFGFYSKEEGITSFYRENSGSYKETQAFSNFVLLNGIVYQEDASEWVSMAKQDFSNPTTNRNAVKKGLTQMLGATPTTFWLKSSSYSTVGRRETEYTLPERFLTPMISKGRVNGFTMQSLKKHPRAGMIKARYPVRISHGATQFLGFFESFDVSENADSPFKFSYSATFKVEKIISTKGY